MQSTEKERPCEVVQSILFRRDSARRDFSAKMVVNDLVERGLDREASMEKVFIEGLLRILSEYASDAGYLDHC
jgi:hypothetical protein